MPVKQAIGDRRSALKARHRAAILDAARSLAETPVGSRFGVEELAERADVARRTVFNHFGSTDGVRVALAEEALQRAIDEVSTTATTAAASGSVVDDLVAVLESADLPAAVVAIERLLRGLEPARVQALTGEAIAHVSDALLRRLVEQRPGIDRLRAALLVRALLGGVPVVAEEWLLRTGGRLDESGRATWHDLLVALIDGVRSGYRVD